jgi:hypothetical protein
VPRISPGPNRVPLSSISIDTLDDDDGIPPDVSFKECAFDGNSLNGGQIAVAINGPATVTAIDCAFRPHGAFFYVREKCTAKQTAVNIRHCEGFVVQGPAFRFKKNASARLKVSNSVFSNPDGNVVPKLLPQAGLIYLDGDASVQYEGKQNVYHYLNAMVERPAKKLISTQDDFRQYLLKNGLGADVNSDYLDSTAAAKLWQQPSPLGRMDQLAFQLTHEFQQRELGIRNTWLGEMPKAPPPVLAKAGPKIVDADGDIGKPGVSKNLQQALLGAQDGDVIFIKHGPKDQEVKVPPIVMKPGAGINVTVKPFEGHKPILILDKAFGDKDSHLIKMRDGSIRFEQMEIRLAPDEALLGTQSMFHLGEWARLYFNNCILTMRSDNGVKCNVVTFVDIDQMMPKMAPPAAAGARVEFRECLIRGKGDLIGLRGCRLLPVEMKDCLVALDGSLLDISATNKAMPMELGVRWKMERSSIFTTKSVFAMHGMMKGLTETKADVEGCLMACLLPEIPAVPAVLFDMETEKLDEPEKCFKWQGTKNYFANFDAVKIREWKNMDLVEGASKFGALTFPKSDDKNMIQDIWKATPEWFRPAEAEQERIVGFGIPADVEKRLIPSPPPKPDD